MFQEVAVPGQGEDPTPEVLLAEITDWVRSRPLESLVARFGGTLPAESLAAQLDYLDEFTASAWNFRRRVSDGPKERNQVDADAVSGADEELAVAAADALGLVRPRPPRYGEYDHVLMLGGLVRANLWRTAYTAHLLANGVSAGDVTAISAYRELARNDTDPSLDEFKLLEAFGLPRRDYEWEVMEDGLRRAFDLPEFTVERESDPSAEGSAAIPGGLGRGRGATGVSHRGSRARARPTGQHGRRLPVLGRPGAAREAGRADPGGHHLHLRSLPACDRAPAPGPAVRLQR